MLLRGLPSLQDARIQTGAQQAHVHKPCLVYPIHASAKRTLTRVQARKARGTSLLGHDNTEELSQDEKVWTQPLYASCTSNYMWIMPCYL